MSTEPKAAITSKSVWGILIVLVAQGAEYIAPVLGASPDPKLQMIGSVLGSALALYGTMTRTAPISGVFKVK